MILHLGNVPSGSTVYIPFHTFNSSGASVTLTGLAVTDIEIYKNGSVTQRASDAGYALLDTDGIDFDGITGIHGFSVDLSDNTDAGFYAVGSFYWVVVSAVTVNSQTVNFVAATFRIVAAEHTSGYPVATIKDGTGTGEIDTTSGGVLVSTLATQAKADVNAEVVDALATDTYAEPGQGSPGATISLSAKIGYLFKAWRNKSTQTSNEYALYADDGATKDQEAAVSDDGSTFERSEVTTGA